MNLTATLYQQTITSVLRRQYGQLRHGTKLLARHACVTPRTARNWLDGVCAPQGAALLRLEAMCGAVDDAMAELRALARGEGG